MTGGSGPLPVVAVVGRPNVGKSSLLNCLAREEAAIVTPVPGTTRDPVERRVEIAGIPLTLVDTAGLRDTDDPVERIGIERTRAVIDRADVVLVLVEARAGGRTDLETHDAQVVADKKVAQVSPLLHGAQQIDDLRLDRNIKR